MSFFNEKQIKGMTTGIYECDECGGTMEFENEAEDILVCPSCGYSIDLERYGFESDEEYEALYPNGESYEDIYGEK